MSEVETITTLIGEFVSMEIEGAENVEYSNEKSALTAFIIVMENGKRYSVDVKQVIA